MIKQLKQYPSAIASVEKELLKLNGEIVIQNQLISFLNADLEKAIANDRELKNEQQRKTKRLELRQQPDYLEVQQKLIQITEKRDLTLINLNQLRNEFSVIKLELKAQIAHLEAVA